jgi:glycerol uptake facilitator protein
MDCITAAWAFAVLLVAEVLAAHLNPIVTLGLAFVGKFAWSQVVPYIVAQMIELC